MKEQEDLNGGELTDIPNDKYKKFFEKFSEIETLKMDQWKPTHILAYFTKKFLIAFNSNYAFKFNSPSPSKCFEIFQVKKLSQLLSSKPEILTKYIDWIFNEKVVKHKKKFRSISFLTNEENLTEYKMMILTNANITRTTLLPIQLENIKTYGDAAFIYQAFKATPNNEEYKTIIGILNQNGITEEVLEKIK